MANKKNFRSAFHGFNREDVVNYIEYLNNKHNAQLEQLNNQLQNALSKPQDSALQAQLDAALAKCAELEAQLSSQGSSPAAPSDTELEAYRRAERAERMARERASQIYQQATAALADATVKVEDASQQLQERIQACMDSAADAKSVLQEAIDVMGAIRPEEE